MEKIHEISNEKMKHLKSDCSKCSGLCCLLCFSQKWMDFPKTNLLDNHVCTCKRITSARYMKNLKLLE